MKKLKQLRSLAAVAALTAFVAVPARADLLLEENFDYDTGSLLGKGTWFSDVPSSYQTTIDVVDQNLTYPGYQDSPAGKAVMLDALVPEGATGNVRYGNSFADAAITEGSVYVSFLFQVLSVPDGKGNTLLSLNGPSASGFNNSKGSQTAKLFIKYVDGSTFKLLADKTAGVATAPEVGTYNIGETYLCVIKFTCNSGTKNDEFNVWVNPTDYTAEGTPTKVGNAGNADPSRGVQGLCLYEHHSSTPSADALVDAIRVATEWTDLFGTQQGGGEDPGVDNPLLSVSDTSIDFGAVLQGTSLTKEIYVSGENLTQGVTITSSDASVSVEPTALTAAEVMSGSAAVTVKYTAGASNLNATLTFASEGAEPASVKLTSEVTPVTSYPSFAMLNNNHEAYAMYSYTGSMAKVSYVDYSVEPPVAYVQDMTGAVMLTSYVDGLQWQTGDKVKNFVLMGGEAAGQYYILDAGTVTSNGNEVSATEATLAAIKQDPESYLYKLVKLSDVTLEPSEGQTWSTAGAVASTVSGSTVTSGRVRTFSGTDLIGVTMPAYAQSVTGVVTNAAAGIVTARSQADVELQAATLDVTPTLLLDTDVYHAVGGEYDYATLTVKASGLTAAASVWIGGQGRDMYSIDGEAMTEIPAGDGEYTLNIKYKPTATGSHTATITFDAQPTELSKTLSLSAKAYDPANPPTLTAAAAALTFEAAVGASQEQSISYTMANGLDYGNARIQNATFPEGSRNAFILGSATLMKTGTYNLKVTFQPQAAGTYEADVVLESPMAETVTVHLSGTAGGSAPAEDKEGDDLAFGDEAALPLYQTDFTSSSVSNKPLALDGWKNVAIEGTRAWWSYTQADGNQVAKAVAYDLKATESTPLTMMLMSPKLSYKEAAAKVLCFNVMGTNMTEDMPDMLLVGILDASTANTESVEPMYIDGLSIPSTAEENNTWAKYVLDAESWDLPDEFYVLFVYNSQRGHETVNQYYIDDFSWGRTDVPYIHTSNQLVEMTGVQGEKSSQDITLEGHNLTEPIALSLGGTHASKFELSHSELPVEGGTFTLHFTPEEIAEHTAIVTAQSGDAARTDILVHVDANSVSAVVDIVSDSNAWGDKVDVYDVNGRTVAAGVSASEAISAMRANRGVLHIVRTTSGETLKYIAK